MTENPAAPRVETVDPGVARVSWTDDLLAEGWQEAAGAVAAAVDAALREHPRVEARVPADDLVAQRIATWSGLHREGVMRGLDDAGRPADLVVYARLHNDLPASEPEGFRALLNSFLPRKRAIGQLLVRSTDDRVLLCQLTYKRDWDLPGGVVEVGESPQLATGREVTEELGLSLPAGTLLLTDWLPPWSGWDDALCLVFDGGRHDPGLVESAVRQEREIHAAEFCTLDQVDERCSEITAARIRSALANLDGAGPAYTEAGRPPV